MKKTGIVSTLVISGFIMAIITPFFSYASTNYALSFNGVNQGAYYCTPNGSLLDCSGGANSSPLCMNPNDNLTISVWVKFDSLSGIQYIFSQLEAQNGNAVVMGLSYSSGYLHFYSLAHSGWWHDNSVSVNFNTGIWYHISVVQTFSNFNGAYADSSVVFYEGTADTNDFQLNPSPIVDTSELTYAGYGNTYIGLFLGEQYMGGGCSSNNMQNLFSGSMDNLQIWHTNLSLNAINQYKFSELSTISHLQDTYYFDNNLLDNSGNANPSNLTGNNSPTFTSNVPLNPYSDSISITYPANQSANIQPFNYFTGNYTAWLSNYYDFEMKIATSSTPFSSNDAFDEQFSNINTGMTASSTTKWQSLSPTLLKNTTYYAQIRQKPHGTTDWTATSDIISFTMSGNLNPYITDTSITSIQLNATTSASTTPMGLNVSCGQQNGIFDTQYATCMMFSFLFAPHDYVLNNWKNLQGEISTKSPFGYFLAYQNAVNTLSTATSSNNFQLADISALNSSILNPINNLLNVLIWVAFSFGIIKRLKHLEL